MARMIDVIGVPFDLISRRGGSSGGPDGLVKAGLISSLEKRGHNVTYVNLRHFSGRDDLFDGAPHESRQAHFMDEYVSLVPLIGRQTGKALIEGSTPLLIGGDRSIALGSIGAAIHPDVLRGERLGLVWISNRYASIAERTEHIEQICRMQLALLLGRGDVRLRAMIEKHSLLPTQVIHIGASAQYESSAGKECLSSLGVPHFSEVFITEKGWYPVFTALFDLAQRVDRIWVMFDLAVVGVHDTATLDSPQKSGGLTREEVLILANRLSHTEKVIGANMVGMNVSLNARDTKKNFFTARLAIDVATQLLK